MRYISIHQHPGILHINNIHTLLAGDEEEFEVELEEDVDEDDIDEDDLVIDTEDDEEEEDDL